MKPRGRNKTLVSLATVQGVFYCLEQAFTYRHGREEWLYDRHAKKRVETFFERAVKDGRLFRGKWQKRQWLTSVKMRRFHRAWYTEALEHSTASWDYTILQSMIFTLMIALDCRPGDIARSQPRFHQKEYMRVQDLKVYISGNEPTFANIRIFVTIKYEKNQK